MGRSLARRAEGIRGFFDSELRKADMKLSRARSDLSEAHARGSELEDRLREMGDVFRGEKDALVRRVEGLEVQNSDLREEVSVLSHSKDAALMRQVEDQSSRCDRNRHLFSPLHYYCDCYN